MVKKYGIISDIHKDPNIIIPAIGRLKDAGAERLILNGDIGGRQGSLEQSQQYTAFILNKLAQSGLETFVQPGSHETLLAYGPVIEHFSDKFSNIIDTTRNSKHSEDDHDLVFLPGSDFLSGGEYQIGNDGKIPSGGYIEANGGHNLVMFDSLEEYVGSIKGMVEIDDTVKFKGFQYFNIGDLRNQVTDPERTIMICHVPRKFDNVETCVDMAEFGDVVEGGFKEYILQDKEGNQKIVIETPDMDHDKFIAQLRKNKGLKIKEVKSIPDGAVIPLQFTKPYIDAGAPVVVKRENRGNNDLRDLYEELGITKAVSGHFHESSHRANDVNGNHVPENTFTNELFWNSGYGDAGHFGVLSIDGTKVSYQNVHLE